MALCNKYVALSSVETCEHAGEAGEEGRGHPRRPPAVCTHPQAAHCVVCESLFYLETILKQILNDVQLPSVNISADKRWGFE